MSDFMPLKAAVAAQLALMEGFGLYSTNTSKDQLWETYLGSFREGDNPIFRTRTEHDCQCCKQFIRVAGGLVAFDTNGRMMTIWDIDVNDKYQPVADAMGELVRSRSINNKFLHYQNNIGTDKNRQDTGERIITWEHFFYKLSDAHVLDKDRIDTELGKYRTSVETFKRALEEITPEAVEMVLDLCAQNSLYKGAEFAPAVEMFKQHQGKYQSSQAYPLVGDVHNNYVWRTSVPPVVSGIRNSAIGTLLVDLSEGRDLDSAVASYEVKVAPTNYKRTTALVTPGMIKKAQQELTDLGMIDSLGRRYARSDDLTINNVLFANRDSKRAMNVFEELQAEVAIDPAKLGKVEEIRIDEFVENVLPNVSRVQMLFTNSHKSNLVSLIAPINPEAPNMLKWNNNFSWSYSGEVTDSITENVKRAGGNVDGVMRFSIQWNDEFTGDNQNDFDAHCKEANGNLIHYPKQNKTQASSGKLDVDIVNPGKSVAVENIVWTDVSRMPPGKYMMRVHNFSQRGGTGFSAEVVFDGKKHSFTYDKPVRNKGLVDVAVVTLDAKGDFTIKELLPSSMASVPAWGINTQTFHDVSMVMLSPNHWDDQAMGNKHWFFMLEGCVNDVSARGFYNEFLANKLTEHRKVFEVLGSKMKAEQSDEQLSGLGFSSTKKDSVIVRVSGSFTRTLKVNF